MKSRQFHLCSVCVPASSAQQMLFYLPKTLFLSFMWFRLILGSLAYIPSLLGNTFMLEIINWMLSYTLISCSYPHLGFYIEMSVFSLSPNINWRGKGIVLFSLIAPETSMVLGSMSANPYYMLTFFFYFLFFKVRKLIQGKAKQNKGCLPRWAQFCGPAVVTVISFSCLCLLPFFSVLSPFLPPSFLLFFIPPLAPALHSKLLYRWIYLNSHQGLYY